MYIIAFRYRIVFCTRASPAALMNILLIRRGGGYALLPIILTTRDSGGVYKLIIQLSQHSSYTCSTDSHSGLVSHPDPLSALNLHSYLSTIFGLAALIPVLQFTERIKCLLIHRMQLHRRDVFTEVPEDITGGEINILNLSHVPPKRISCRNCPS